MKTFQNKENIIPKKLHYCWFGGQEKSAQFARYLSSRKKWCPSYEIIERNEQSFDIHKHPYTQKLWKEKKRAFLVDYVRFSILYNEGGVYLDTDIELTKNLDCFLAEECFLGFESKKKVNGAIIGAIPHHWFIKELLNHYHTNPLNSLVKILLPNILTDKLQKYGLSSDTGEIQHISGITVYPKEYFYPFAYYEIHSEETTKHITEHTYAIHRNEATRMPPLLKNIIFLLMRIYKKISNS